MTNGQPEPTAVKPVLCGVCEGSNLQPYEDRFKCADCGNQQGKILPAPEPSCAYLPGCHGPDLHDAGCPRHERPDLGHNFNDSCYGVPCCSACGADEGSIDAGRICDPSSNPSSRRVCKHKVVRRSLVCAECGQPLDDPAPAPLDDKENNPEKRIEYLRSIYRRSEAMKDGHKRIIMKEETFEWLASLLLGYRSFAAGLHYNFDETVGLYIAHGHDLRSSMTSEELKEELAKIDAKMKDWKGPKIEEDAE